MKTIGRTLGWLAVSVVFAWEWWSLPVVIGKARGDNHVNEAWGMLGTLTFLLPVALAKALARGATVRQVLWLLGLGLIPGAGYFLFNR